MKAFLSYIGRNLYFSLREIVRNILRSLLSSFGIIFLIAFLVLYLSLRQSIKEYIGGTLFGTLDINEIVVSPPASGAGELISMGGRAEKIAPDRVRRIRNIRGVGEINSILRMEYPAKVKLEMFGRSVREYMPVYGISPAFLRKSEKRWRQFVPGAEIPVIVPKFVLDVFNNLAAARGLPQLGEKALWGFPMELVIETAARGAPERRKYDQPARVFGFSAELPLTGLVVPSDFITGFAAAHVGDPGAIRPGFSYAQLVVTVKDVKDLPEISKKIQALGLKVESQQEIAAKTNKALAVIDGSSLVIMGIFLFLTVIAIFNSYLTIVYNRSYTFSLQRVIGVSKARIILTFVFEAAVIGALFGLIGYYMGVMAIGYLKHNMPHWVPVLKGLTLTRDTGGLLPLAVGLSALLSSVSAFIPAVFASNMNLFKAVQK
jgi:ABC-type lipoprotein release transport system permease subunit